jgi:hypothetical protein
MEHLGRYLAFCIFLFFVFGGLVTFGLVTGTLPTKSGLSRREDGPIAFYFMVGIYACMSLLPLFGAIDLILRMNHHNGLW